VEVVRVVCDPFAEGGGSEVLNEDELAMFDLLMKDPLARTEHEVNRPSGDALGGKARDELPVTVKVRTRAKPTVPVIWSV
jgi:hypothetical protein